MVAVDLFWFKGQNPFADIVSTNGTSLGPFAGGKIFFRDAGTSNPRVMYQNREGTTPVPLTDGALLLDASGRLPCSVYVPVGNWKFIFQNSAGVEQITEDQIPGALDTSGFEQEFTLPETPVINKASDYVILVADRAKVINGNPTGGTIVQTLPSAASAGDGWRITIRHVGTANQVTVAAVSGQTINGATSRSLTVQFESICLVSDGANWHIDGYAPGLIMGGLPFFKVADRLTAPPASPLPGARYILNGTGTGAWSVYTLHDVLESNGQGGWIKYTPTDGWCAYIEDENVLSQFRDTAWLDLSNVTAPTASALQHAIFSHQLASGSDGGVATASSWITHTLNTTEENTITGCSRSSNDITLPAGDYIVMHVQSHRDDSGVLGRFKSTTTAKAVYSNTGITNTAENSVAPIVGMGVLNLSAQEIFRLEYYRNGAGAAADLGSPATAGVNEQYARVVIISLSSLQGPQGIQGTQGPQGFAGFKYRYSNSTTVPADPGTGLIRYNSLTLSSITASSIDATSIETGNPDVSDEIARWDDTGILKMTKIGAEQNWATFDVTNVVDNGGYLDLTLVYRAHAGTFSDTNDVSLQFIPKGAAGVTGSTIPVFDYLFKTATAGDPTSGGLLFNNATLSAATTFSISDLDALAVDRSAEVGTWDDNGASTNRGNLYVINATTGARIATFKATGSITDNGTYQTMSVTYIAGAAVANNTRVAVMFVPAGATGAIGGSTGSTDRALLLADGGGGTTIQGGRATESSSGKITVNYEDASTNTVVNGLKVSRTSSGTPANGIGTGIEFEVETAAANNEIGATIEAVTTDTTSTSEDFDLVFKLMAAGAAVAEFFRVGTTAIIAKVQAYFATVTLTDGANIAWNLQTAQTAKVTLGGNRTLDAPTNMKDGATYILRIIQDGTGSRTLSWNAAYKFPGGTDPVLSTGANAVDVVTFVSDGTSLFGVAQKAFA